MISLIFKFSIAFIFSFVILSFKLNDRPLFYHLTEFTGPLGTDVQKSLGKSVKRSLSKTQELGKNLIRNADPKYIEDAINSQRSSVGKNKTNDMILEDIRRDEVRKLDELIKSEN
jgi:hypothetical protein